VRGEGDDAKATAATAAALSRPSQYARSLIQLRAGRERLRRILHDADGLQQDGRADAEDYDALADRSRGRKRLFE
jgi:hypothetical protein